MPYDQHDRKSYVEALDSYNADDLKKMLRTLLDLLMNKENAPMPLFTGEPSNSGKPKVPTRKKEVIDMLVEYMADTATMQLVFTSLPPVEQNALREMTWRANLLDNIALHAKYGETLGDETLLFRLFLFNAPRAMLLPHLNEQLKTFVAEPPEVAPHYTPEFHLVSAIEDLEAEALDIHQTESAALYDVRAVMRLMDAEGVEASAQTYKVSNRGAHKILEILKDGDFYPVHKKTTGMKPFAWGLIFLAAGMAALEGRKLRLTEKGKKASKLPEHELIKELWGAWLQYMGFQELNRVTEIKGQKTKSNILERAPLVRKKIADGLALLKPGEWIHVDDFAAFMKAKGMWFEAARNYWGLYILDSRYGHLGYDESRGIVDTRFLLVFLLEYAAVMGIVDVALVAPHYARYDYSDLWGGDDLEQLSDYDGLYYIRLTELGGHVLGLTEEYTPPKREVKRYFEIMPNLDILLMDDDFNEGDRILLERMATKTSQMVWHLDAFLIVKAVDSGLPVDEIRDFLTANSDDALPEPVESLLEEIGEKSTAVKMLGKEIVLQIKDETTTQELLKDKKINKLVHLSADNHLVIKEENKKKFKNALLKKGYIVSI